MQLSKTIDYSFMCDIQIENGMQLGNDHLGRDVCGNFSKAMSGVLSDKTKEYMKLVRFISIMSDGSTDSSVTEQESVLIYVHPETHAPVTALASIENLESATANTVYAAIKSKCGITLGNNEVEDQPKIACVNMDGAAVNMGAKNGVAKQINDQVNNKVIVMHCVAHKLELGILDAVKDVVYLKKIEDELKRICKFYSFSPKRGVELKKLSQNV
ncbi:unnamed protein product [Mytilus edulis]|uniref:Zinc finger protein 862 n=1 Tax=Mytilus edulis TaxID=6550 RepID=A0A8S3VMK7_MYTED|nr:unnamed protein product [Mytilus edulis]